MRIFNESEICTGKAGTIINYHLSVVRSFSRAESLGAVTVSEWLHFSDTLLKCTLYATMTGAPRRGDWKPLDNCNLLVRLTPEIMG